MDEEEVSIQLEPILGSSHIAATGYVEEKQIMIVEYLNGAQYRWEGIPAAAYEAMRGADSVGSALNQITKVYGKGMRIG